MLSSYAHFAFLLLLANVAQCFTTHDVDSMMLLPRSSSDKSFLDDHKNHPIQPSDSRRANQRANDPRGADFQRKSKQEVRQLGKAFNKISSKKS